MPPRVPLARQALGGNVEDAGEVLRLGWRVCLASTCNEKKEAGKSFQHNDEGFTQCIVLMQPKSQNWMFLTGDLFEHTSVTSAAPPTI